MESLRSGSAWHCEQETPLALCGGVRLTLRPCAVCSPWETLTGGQGEGLPWNGLPWRQKTMIRVFGMNDPFFYWD